jgi:hypothetical protein
MEGGRCMDALNFSYTRGAWSLHFFKYSTVIVSDIPDAFGRPVWICHPFLDSRDIPPTEMHGNIKIICEAPCMFELIRLLRDSDYVCEPELISRFESTLAKILEAPVKA